MGYFDVVDLFFDGGGDAQLVAAEGAGEAHGEIEVSCGVHGYIFIT